MTKSRPTRKKLPEAVRRADIIEAARKLFARQGYERTKVEDIAALAGLTKGGLYFHFADKQALFQETIASRIVAMEAHMDRLRDHADGPLEQIRALFRALVEEFRQDFNLENEEEGQGAIDLFLEAHRMLAIRVIMQEFYRRIRDFVREAVERGKALGLVGDVDTGVAGVAAVAMMTGFVVQYALEPKAFDLEVMAARAGSFFLRSIKAT